MSVQSGEHKVAITFWIATIVAFHVDSQSFCTTPRGKSGVCVPESTCRTITQLLRLWPNPPPPQVVRFVELSQCGIFNDVIHVCCERNSTTVGGALPPGLSPPHQGQPALTQTSTITTTTSTTEESGSGTKILPSVPKSNADVQSGMAIMEASDCKKIINDYVAPLSEYPWLALLVYTDGFHRTMDCGGSLITERYVLTAAHCLRFRNKTLVSVRLGEHDIDETTDCSNGDCAPPIQEIDVEESIYHRDYNSEQNSDDIGLIRLIRKAIFRSNVQPICLPITQELQEEDPFLLITAGWGRTGIGPRTNIQQSFVTYNDTNSCPENLTDNLLCVKGNREMCGGDSGGPVFFQVYNRDASRRFIQNGIMTAGSFTCRSNTPIIFLKVASYLPWITGNLRP